MTITPEQFAIIKTKAAKLGDSLTTQSTAVIAADAAHQTAAQADADAVLKDAAKADADTQVTADFADLKDFIDGLS